MHEVWLTVVGYLRDTWRYRWYAILVAWIITMAGWPLVMQLPDQYESSARIYVDTDSLLQPLLRGLTIQPNVQQRLQIMTRTLLSRPNLEKIARMTDMDLSAETPQQMEAVLGTLERKINLRADPHSPNLYTIAYEDNSPRLAKTVVQSVVTLFIENALKQVHQDRDSAYAFLDQQIAAYESRIRATEVELMRIKRQHKGAIPGDIGDYFQHLEAAEKTLQAARTQLNAAEKQRDELVRQIENRKSRVNAGQPIIAEAGLVSHIDNRIKALEVKLDGLLLQYTERHPEVATIKEFIASLRHKKQELLEQHYNDANDANDEGALKVATPSPQSHQLGIALAAVKGDIAFQKSRVAILEEEINKIHTLINTMPEVALQLSELHRAYSIDKQNYATLLERREAAEMAEKVEQSAENIKFRVVDPPTLPLQPSAPNRPRLFTVVLLMGLAGGAGVAFLLSQLKPTVATRRDLQELTELPVLGSVSVILTPGSLLKRRLKLTVFLLSFGLLVAAYGVVLSIDYFDINMSNYLDQAMDRLGV